MTPKSKRRTRVASTQQESKAFLMSMIASVLVTAEAQGVHEAEGHGVGTPAETALGRVELWKNVGGNASVNEVFKKFESARRERNVGVKRKWGHHLV